MTGGTIAAMLNRIVVLDGYTLSPAGEPSWDGLGALGDLELRDRTPASEVASRLADAEAAITNKAVLDAAVFAACPALRYVGVSATGTNVVDLAAASAHGVTVTNVPGYAGPSVGQHTWALILALANRVAEHDAAVHAGDWVACEDFSFLRGRMVELSGKALGIVGAGAIGGEVARIGAALGMTVLGHTRRPRDIGVPVEWLSVDELFAQADVVSLHCPLTPETQGLVDDARLASMKSTALLINTGRGPLIDEAALAAALRDGRLAGAGLDVLSTEPPAADNPLLMAPNCVITPHNAWQTAESKQRLMDAVVENLAAWARGEPVNVVTPAG